MLTPADLHAVAGFLIGEGSFLRYRAGSLRVTATQRERAPLDRLQAIIGGRVYWHARSGVNGGPIWAWYLGGVKGVGLMMTLLPIITSWSPKRAATIRAHLAAWRAALGVGGLNRAKTHCKYGHPFTGRNLVRERGGKQRRCRTCGNRRSRESRQRLGG